MKKLTSSRRSLGGAIWQGLALTSAAVVLNFGPTAVAKAKRPHLTVTIHVYNYAEVSPETLVQAEQATDVIFRKLGIDIRWLSAPLSPLTRPESSPNRTWFHSADIQLNIISSSMSDSLGPSPDMGFAVAVGPSPQVAYVLYGHAERLARRQLDEAQRRESSTGRAEARANLSQIMGHVMAHELGHLLGLRSHSGTGIMRADWDLTDLHDIASGCLVFTSPQADTIRAELGKRTASETLSLDRTAR
jgi:hypothetical protein